MTQRHKEIIQLVQAHGEGKTIQQRKGGDWVDTNLTLHDFLELVANPYTQLRIKPKPRYRAWREDEVPETAQYMKRIYEGDVSKPILSAKDVAPKLQYMFETYLYRTDLSKNEWFVCGVEVSDE